MNQGDGSPCIGIPNEKLQRLKPDRLNANLIDPWSAFLLDFRKYRML